MRILRIIPLSLIAITLLSCSSSHDDTIDNTPENNLVGITFGNTNSDNWQDAPTTRATDTGLETLFNTFRVWGFKTSDATLHTSQLVMDGYKAEYANNTTGSTVTNTNGWEYVGVANPNLSATQTIKYWDYSASSYRFMAYSPFDAKVNVTFATTNDDSSYDTSMSFAFPYEYSDVAIATTSPYISNLWYSTNDNATTQYGKSVKLTFTPMIAKVRFKFTYPEGTDEITMKNIVFCDSRFITDPSTATTPLKGTVKATYSITGTPSNTTTTSQQDINNTSPVLSWSPSAQGATGQLVFSIPYEDEDDAIHVVKDAKQYKKWYFVPPLDIVPYEQGPYTITAIIDGNYSSATVPSAFTQWKAGYQYTYIFKITEAGTVITFSDLQVEQWLIGDNIDNQGTGTEGW